MLRVSQVRAAVEVWYPPALAESWDAIGLVCGDPDQPVGRVLLAVDATPATVAEAGERGAQLLLTHHPLLLTGVHGVGADTPKGALVHRMIRSGIAHLVAHTNADAAAPGVSDALAARLDLRWLRPLIAAPGPALDTLSVFVPTPDAPALIDALARAGAGRLGDYEQAAWQVAGTGQFRPLPGAQPAVGQVGELATVAETRVDILVDRRHRAEVLRALHAAHPYETPAFSLVAQVDQPGVQGTGRVGELAATTSLEDVVRRVAERLPATVWGVRAAGDPRRPVRTVAVCGGSGGGFAEAARAAGADAYLTADLRHHPVLEAVGEQPDVPGAPAMALVDAAHWATERPWLDQLAGRLSAEFAGLKVDVSDLVTDPWTLHHPSPSSSRSPGPTDQQGHPPA